MEIRTSLGRLQRAKFQSNNLCKCQC